MRLDGGVRESKQNLLYACITLSINTLNKKQTQMMRCRHAWNFQDHRIHHSWKMKHFQPRSKGRDSAAGLSHSATALEAHVTAVSFTTSPLKAGLHTFSSGTDRPLHKIQPPSLYCCGTYCSFGSLDDECGHRSCVS